MTAVPILESESPAQDAERRAFQSLAEIIGITNEMFGEVRIKQSFDPEFPADKYLVFIVYASGTAKELLALEMQWIENVCRVGKNLESFRLSIRPTT
jgi:hypothetical protein